MTPKQPNLITHDTAYLIAILLVSVVVAYRQYSRPLEPVDPSTPRITVCAQIQNEVCDWSPPPLPRGVFVAPLSGARHDCS